MVVFLRIQVFWDVSVLVGEWFSIFLRHYIPSKSWELLATHTSEHLNPQFLHSFMQKSGQA